MPLILRSVALLLVVALIGCGVLLAYWAWRPNRSRVDPALALETWSAVRDGLHNSNTDLLFWRGQFWLVHASSPFHMGSRRCRLRLWRSLDARAWERVAEFAVPDEDIRDPKLAAIGGRLLLYAFPNAGLRALPYGTIVASSSDGTRWSGFEPITQPGWLLWRPKSLDGVTWYVPGYWHEHGRSALFSSKDGVEWTWVSEIHAGEGNDETDCEFLPDGRLLCTARLEVTPDNPWGHRDASTLLAVAEPPYLEWSKARSTLTRLDGPALFRDRGRVFAVARHQPGRRLPLRRLGGVLSRKRTALYLVEPERLVHLSDLPSAGDTSYAGVVLREGELTASYYTSDIRRDYPWALGMLAASEIRIARVALDALHRLAEARAAELGTGGARGGAGPAH